MKSTRMATTVAVAGLRGRVRDRGRRRRRTKKSVTISVASLIPGSTQAAIQQFNAQVAEFEKANPSIKVKPVEYQWTGPTFAAKLAAGTLPTVFEVPFTDARTLGDNGQLADLTAGVKSLPYFSKYNPAVLAEGTDSKGQIVALPKACLRAGTALQPQALHAGGAQPEQASDDMGAGRGRREADRSEDRQGRLRPDGEGRQHGRLDSHDARLRARWADGDTAPARRRWRRSTTRRP